MEIESNKCNRKGQSVTKITDCVKRKKETCLECICKWFQLNEIEMRMHKVTSPLPKDWDLCQVHVQMIVIQIQFRVESI